VNDQFWIATLGDMRVVLGAGCTREAALLAGIREAAESYDDPAGPVQVLVAAQRCTERVYRWVQREPGVCGHLGPRLVEDADGCLDFHPALRPLPPCRPRLPALRPSVAGVH